MNIALIQQHATQDKAANVARGLAARFFDIANRHNLNIAVLRKAAGMPAALHADADHAERDAVIGGLGPSRSLS